MLIESSRSILPCFELVDDVLELLQSRLEVHRGDIGMGCIGHQSSSSAAARRRSPEPRMSACTWTATEDGERLQVIAAFEHRDNAAIGMAVGPSMR